MCQSKGLVYYGPGIKAYVSVDQGLSDFYRSLIPKYYNAKPQKYKSHITIVRLGKEFPKNMSVWKKHQGLNVNFFYDNEIQSDGKYFWLNVQSEDIEKIREELGLPKFRDDRKFGGILRKEYHITIANIKD